MLCPSFKISFGQGSDDLTTSWAGATFVSHRFSCFHSLTSSLLFKTSRVYSYSSTLLLEKKKTRADWFVLCWFNFFVSAHLQSQTTCISCLNENKKHLKVTSHLQSWQKKPLHQNVRFHIHRLFIERRYLPWSHNLYHHQEVAPESRETGHWISCLLTKHKFLFICKEIPVHHQLSWRLSTGIRVVSSSVWCTSIFSQCNMWGEQLILIITNMMQWRASFLTTVQNTLICVVSTVLESRFKVTILFFLC